MNEIEKYRKQINEVSFIGLEGIECGDVLYYPLKNYIEKNLTLRQKRIKKNFKLSMTIATSFFRKTYNFYESGKGTLLFLYSNAYGNREDLWSNFYSVSELFNDKIVIFPEKSFSFSIKKIEKIKYLIMWNKQLKKIIKDTYTRFFIVKELFLIYIDYLECIDIIKNKKINLLVSFCDVHPLESLFTQFFNLNSINTVTLQHGVYSSVINNWVFLGSKSLYMLGFGQFTYDEGAILGIEKNKIKKIGAMSAIGVNLKNKPKSYKNNIMGLILDGEEFYELNKRMISFAQDFCLKRNIKLLIKFHPTSNKDDYKQYISSKQKIELYSNEILLKDFVKMIDFAIVRNSTCIIELLQLWIPTFIYSEKKQLYDVYKNIKFGKFTSDNELEYYINNINSEKVKKVITYMREYFCESGDPSNRFKNTLIQLNTKR